MDPRLTSSLLAVLLFLVFSCDYACDAVKKFAHLKGDMSLLARAALFGVVLYFSSTLV